MPNPDPHRSRRSKGRPGRMLRSGLGVLCLLAALGTASCSDSDDQGAPATTTIATKASPSTSTTVASTTTTLEDVEAAIREAIDVSTDAFYDVLTEPDPDDPRLEIHRTEPSLSIVRGVMDDYIEEGIRADYSRARPKWTIDSVTVNGDTAEATICLIDSSYAVWDDGSIENDSESSRLQRFDLVFDSEWLVSGGETYQRWADSEGCEE